MRLAAYLIFCFPLILSVHAEQSTHPDETEQISWTKGPLTARLGNVATIEVPEGYAFTDGDGARRFLALNQNPASGHELGLIIPLTRTHSSAENNWFALFEFDDIGYVTDDDKLDDDAILSSIQRGTERANETRKAKGWPAFHVTGWAERPFYDPANHNLTWAIKGQDESGSASAAVNYSVRILGRRGSLSVDLVLDPSALQSTLPKFQGLLGGFQYLPGNRYAEFLKGDKVAGYGLTALIAGGATAAAIKTGLFSKLWRLLAALIAALWKLLVFVIAAIAAAFRRFWAKLTKKTSESPSPVQQ
jgi:uncharacterized membrane-anchored protein